MSAQKKTDTVFPMYKDKPLVRCGNVIYYGSMKDPYVIKMTIKSEKTVGKEEVADKITVQLLSTDTSLSVRKQIVKTSEKNGLYLAMDIAEAWLERSLNQAAKEKA
ncbi:MAG: hypothetical protein PUC32_00335 [Oscillospiraceae bacterium]|nr:hypothetical protein [Oscillospiraceae bacterium]